MAERAVTVDTDGTTGDYASVQAAITGELVVESDLSGTGDFLTITCQATTDAADTTAATVNGFTTAAANYVSIEAGASDRARSTGYVTSKFRMTQSDTIIMAVQDNHVRVDGIQFGLTITANNTAYCYNVTAVATGDLRASNCYFEAVSMAGTGQGMGVRTADADADLTMWNCIFNNFLSGADTAFRATFFSAKDTVFLYNCLAYGCYHGFSGGGNGIHNSVSFNNTNDFDGTWTTIDFCASDDNDGTNNVAGNEADADWTTDFNDAANGDFTLLTGSPLKGGGTDDPSGSGFGDPDINGDSRTSTWDVGPDEFIAVAATGQAFRLRAIEKYFMPIFDNITGKIKEIGQYIRGMIKGKKRIVGGQCAGSLS